MKKILIILFIVSFSTRLFFLFNGHNSLTHDEADFYYNGYLVSKTGSDIYGNKLFFTSGILSAAANVPIYISSIFWDFFQYKSVLLGRLPLVIFNSFTPVILFLLIYSLTTNLFFSLITFFVFNFSPWFMNLSTTAGFESLLSLLFVLLGTLSLTLLRRYKFSKFFLFCFFNFLAFNSYMGYRFVAPFSMIFQLTIANWGKHYFGKNALKKYSSYLFVSLTLFIIFIIPTFIFPNTSTLIQRALNDNVFTNKDIVGNVIWYGTETTSSPLVGRMFSNKFFTPSALFLKSWLNTFNIPSLFSGETSQIYGMRILGLFFMTDIFLLLLGLVFFKEYFPKKIYPVLLILLFGGLPFAINPQGVTIALRGLMLIIPYSLIIANGYYYLLLKHKKIFVVSSMILVINVTSLFFLYVYRIKVLSSEAFHASDKVIIEELIKSNETVYIFPREFKPFVLLYAFYSSDDPYNVKPQLRDDTIEMFVNKEKTVYIFRSCEKYNNIKKGSLILLVRGGCGQKGLSIIKSYVAQDRSGEILYDLIRK